ncbi:hypothetical protein L9F63_015438 [Diploptera punctata]|uniref:CHK kinase-like domain-containing protein n=1 Tax=Diploptera punctata TaxID=6984 RepID=A0AAD8A634_DIPPU|nr:hypothetical protein L9F63_015438 [Diploptera punctata]
MIHLTKKELEDLLHPKFGNDLVVESFTSKPLTAPGENFGSFLWAMEVEIRHGKKDKSKQNLSVVAKLPPPSEYLKRLFDIENTFYKEIVCYIEVKDLYEKFQKEMDISKDKYVDLFPECYGARTTLSPEIGEAADENVVILLENLKTSNYDTPNQRIGLDYKHMKLAVSYLARFHAISVAIKLLKPKLFEKIILKACRHAKIGINEKECQQHNQSIINNISVIAECKNYIEKIKRRLDEGTKALLVETREKPKEPYACMVHLDFWSNNMMFLYDSKNLPFKVKFLDFQGVQYDSPAKDLIFFLYSSAADGVMPKYYDEFVQTYYENFIDCLKDFNCDVTPFAFDHFLAEINNVAQYEMNHILFMLMIICADKNDVVADMSLVQNDNLISKSNPIYEKRAKEVILDFVKKGWL